MVPNYIQFHVLQYRLTDYISIPPRILDESFIESIYLFTGGSWTQKTRVLETDRRTHCCNRKPEENRTARK